MTKQEIKDLVSAKIAGQGNQIDLGGALPQVIDAILEIIPIEKVMTVDMAELWDLNGRQDVTKQELLAVGVDIENCSSYDYVLTKHDSAKWIINCANDGISLLVGTINESLGPGFGLMFLIQVAVGDTFEVYIQEV